MRTEALAAWIATAIALLFAALWMWNSREFALDDAWIHLAYAKSLRSGAGISYNPNDWETGFSSPLWLALLGVWPLGADPVTSVKLLGLLLHGVTTWLGAHLVIDLGRQRAGIDRPVPLGSLVLLAGTLIACSPPLLEGATSGMEVPLAAAMTLAVLRVAVLGVPWGWALACGMLATWARPETLFVTVTFGVALGVARWYGERRTTAAVRSPLATAVGGVLGLCLWIVYCLVVSGQPWPNAQYVKGTGGGLDGLRYVTEHVLPWQPWIVGLTGVVLVALAIRSDIAERRPECAAAIAAWVVAMLGIAVSRPLHVGVLFFESRYFAFASAIPLVVLPFGVLGRSRWLAAALVIAVGIVTGLQLPHVWRMSREHEHDTSALHTRVARYLASIVPPDAVVAVEGAGAPRFFAPRSVEIVDLVGLNDRRAARLHFDRNAKICHFVGRGPTHMALPHDWVAIYKDVFVLRPLETFVDEQYHQVEPPRPMQVTVFAVQGVAPAWQDRCGM